MPVTNNTALKTIEWTPAGVVLIDQRKLPQHEEYRLCRTYLEVAQALRSMTIRGAPAIGVAAAMGIALGVRQSPADNLEKLAEDFRRICDTLAATRPTGVNLFWAIGRMRMLFEELVERRADLATIRARLEREEIGRASCRERVYGLV